MGRAGEIPEVEYSIGGVERKVSLVGNRLGDNAPRVIFELLGTDEQEEELEGAAPAVARSADSESEEPEAEEEEQGED
jgi:large subunit ribosomal protein L17